VPLLHTTTSGPRTMDGIDAIGIVQQSVNDDELFPSRREIAAESTLISALRSGRLPFVRAHFRRRTRDKDASDYKQICCVLRIDHCILSRTDPSFRNPLILAEMFEARASERRSS
jgi:hypothetical protein